MAIVQAMTHEEFELLLAERPELFSGSRFDGGNVTVPREEFEKLKLTVYRGELGGQKVAMSRISVEQFVATMTEYLLLRDP